MRSRPLSCWHLPFQSPPLPPIPFCQLQRLLELGQCGSGLKPAIFFGGDRSGDVLDSLKGGRATADSLKKDRGAAVMSHPVAGGSWCVFSGEDECGERPWRRDGSVAGGFVVSWKVSSAGRRLVKLPS